MTYVPITPFRRTVDSGLIEHQKYATADLPCEGVNKYDILRELTAARKQIGVTDRTLAVLQALLSFYPKAILGGDSDAPLVYPSNIAICERLNGMPCSTMRRHLGTLVQVGLIMRRDSPNGKRYVKRYRGDQHAFGFDLSPLLSRFAEICGKAQAAREADDQVQRLRRAVSLMRRDLAGLAEYGAQTRPDLAVWDAFSDVARLTARALRRTLSLVELTAIETQLTASLDHAKSLFDLVKTDTMGTIEPQNEHHHQNSNKDSIDLEPCLDPTETGCISSTPETPIAQREVAEKNLPNIPIKMVLEVCQEIHTYAPNEIRHWHELIRAAEIVWPMMGISRTVWDDAVSTMGAEKAAVVVVAMLERFSEIKSPGGYLRHLTNKATDRAFSCGPMIMALMRREAA